MSVAPHQSLTALLHARARLRAAEIDYQRALVAAAEDHSQHAIARSIGISQPGILSRLRTARKVPMPPPGQLYASPYEVCLRHAAGELSRTDTITTLTTWHYTDTTTANSDELPAQHGSLSEILEATDEGLIDPDLRDTILHAITSTPPARTTPA